MTITGSGEGFSYATALKKARDDIPLAELGIEKSRIRRAINGGRIIEILGVNAAEKADKLAEKLSLVLGPEVTISRPCLKGEIRIVGLDDTVSPEEVIAVISELGGCLNTDIKVGSIRMMANGLGVVWAQCPLAAANRVSAKNKIRIGWTTARVELLPARLVQCFRCWKFGHTKYNCGSQTDLSNKCFRCGESGHAARHCEASPKCVVCETEKLDSAHRYGSINCSFKPGPSATNMINPSNRRTEEVVETKNGSNTANKS